MAKVVRITAYIKRAIPKLIQRFKSHTRTITLTRKRKQRLSQVEIPTKKPRKAAGNHKQQPIDKVAHKKATNAYTRLLELTAQPHIKQMIAKIDPIGIKEYQASLTYWIKHIQREEFKTELQFLEHNQPVPGMRSLI